MTNPKLEQRVALLEEQLAEVKKQLRITTVRRLDRLIEAKFKSEEKGGRENLRL